MAKRICFIWICFSIILRNSADEYYNHYAKFMNPVNIYVGSDPIQKIQEFYIDEAVLACTNRYLPIIFSMVGEDAKNVDVKGWLTEHGNLIQAQANSSLCHLFKKC